MGLQPQFTQSVTANKMSFYDRGNYLLNNGGEKLPCPC